MKFEKLYAWLKDPKSNLTFVRDYDRQENFMKVSFSEKIDLIYHQRVIDAHALAPKLPFFYCGLYNKQDGKLYASEFPLKGNLPEIDSGETFGYLQKNFNQDVRRYLIQYFEKNADTIRKSLSADKALGKVYRWCNEEELKLEAQDCFRKGIKSEDISYKIHFHFEFLGQMSMIRYVDNPSEIVKDEAEWFLAANRDLVRCIIQEHDVIERYLKQWESLNNGDSHKEEGERVCEI